MGCRGGGKWVVAFFMGNGWNAVMAWDERLVAGIDWLRMKRMGFKKLLEGWNQRGLGLSWDTCRSLLKTAIVYDMTFALFSSRPEHAFYDVNRDCHA
jgi:hypothetical protein